MLNIIGAGLIAIIYFLTPPKFSQAECRRGVTFRQYWQREHIKVLVRGAIVYAIWVLLIFMPIIGYPRDIFLALAATVLFEDICFCSCTSKWLGAIALIVIATVCLITLAVYW